MNKRLNYRKLLKQWMQYYSLSAEKAKSMFEVIRQRLRDPTGKSDQKGGGDDETNVE